MKLLRKGLIGSALILSATVMLGTSCKSYNDIAARFTPKHIKENNNKVVAQVPDTYELGYILLSLTEVGQRDAALLNKSTPYYKEVSQYFSAYKDHKAVKLLNKELTEDESRFKDFKTGLYAFRFNDDRLVLKSDYRIDLNRISFSRYIPLLHDFVEKSNFHSFYTQHQGLYTKLIQHQNQQLNMDSAWKLVEKQYKTPFQSYQVILSPLMKGETTTLAVNSHRFSECLIFTEASDKGTLMGQQ